MVKGKGFCLVLSCYFVSVLEDMRVGATRGLWKSLEQKEKVVEWAWSAAWTCPGKTRSREGWGREAEEGQQGEIRQKKEISKVAGVEGE